MDDPGTETLRKLAPSWSLAGDEQLLSILQNTHQRLLSKCQEANTQLEQMATALSDASISLQNVNNQFMALSSSQFIESRVYDDDDLEAEVPVVKEPPKPLVPDELTTLKRSVSVLENAHEIITILHDSDTESDTDDDMPARLVLKPKDMYSDRPLPYIIGSQPWKNKWHAGLLLEDTDSDSSLSKVDHDSEQYSQSEPEDNTDKLRLRHTRDTTISETSSELPSDQGSLPKPTPSDVASEIARRLGAREPPQTVDREPEYEEPVKPAVRKVYRPQDPVKSRIFPESPPPLSDSDSQQSDVFAELHRQPYADSRLAQQLFDDHTYDSDEGDIFSDFANKPVSDPSAKPTSIFDAGPTPHMFVKHTPTDDRRPASTQRTSLDRPQGNTEHRTAGIGREDRSYDERRVNMDEYVDERRTDTGADDGKLKGEVERGVKKPVGGISLFGNKGTESIGAAILKRNQRKSSTSGDDSGSDAKSEALNNEHPIRKEKDIFDDLFARSEGKKVAKDKGNLVKDIKSEIRKKTEEKVKDKKVEKPKVDLFSDNLFDDIDDIFSSNVVKMPAKDNTTSKSIFEDDDDLFSDIAVPKTVKNEASNSKINKESLFDSDDELFSDTVIQSKHDEKPKTTTSVSKTTKINENSLKNSELPKISDDITRSIFDDDEDDIFSDVKITKKVNEVTKVQNTTISTDKYNDLSKGDGQASGNIDPPKSNTNVFNSPSLFDDDDESDLFAEPTKSTSVRNDTVGHNKNLMETFPNKNENNIPEQKLQNNFDFIPSSSVKTDDFDQKAVDDDEFNTKHNKTIENDVNVVNNTSESIKSFEKQVSALPVTENVDRNNLNTTINSETVAAKVIEHKNNKNVEQKSSETNDFSDQDFDDLPPKVEINKNIDINTNIVTEHKSKEQTTDLHNIFDNNTLQNDIFAKMNENKQNMDNSERIFKDNEPDFLETHPKNIEKTEEDNKQNEIDTQNIEADIFSDIITEPPAFEKPKEPKKSKNVNALFDDDSDDESLFFKKNDPIFEDNPEDFSPTQDRLFGLFTDEPPDDGFGKISDDLSDDMFSTLPKPRIPQNESLPPLPNTVHFEDNTVVLKTEDKVPETNKIDSDADIFSSLPENKIKPEIETPKDPDLDTNNKIENIFKVPSTENLQNSLPFIEKQESRPRKKPTISDQLTQGLLSDDEDLFSSIPTHEHHSTSLSTPKQEPLPEKQNQDSVKTSDDELFKTVTKTEIPKEDLLKPKLDSKSDADSSKLPKNKVEFKPTSETNQISEKHHTDSKPVKAETKKVGKLKAGLNINVNALLPGARSPKKVKPNDQPDGQIISVAENKKLEPKTEEIEKSESKTVPETEKSDPTLVKAVSFDGKPESEVLDNKLSKERPRIQVKRRPSTRKARKEAVRKSGIDFGEDSTDNSSSIDDPPRIKSEIQPDTDELVNKDDEISKKSKEEKIENPSVSIENIEKSINQSKPEETTMQAEIQANATIQPDNVEKQTEFADKPTYSRDVTSKVVYILNDEDIFNTSPVEKPESMNKNLDRKSENLDSNTGVTTLGKVYPKSVNIKKETKSSLFGEDDDERIFKGQPSEKKISIFDSDSEEELFGTSKKEAEKKDVKKEIKREVVKGPLFGDEDDDDDLFGVKTKKIAEPKPQPSRSTVKETPKSTEPVFEDPLSMFGDDD